MLFLRQPNLSNSSAWRLVGGADPGKGCGREQAAQCVGEVGRLPELVSL